MRQKLFSCAAVMLACAGVSDGAVKVFVSPDGDDDGDGRSEHAAVRSIGRAQEIVRHLPDDAVDVTVRLAAGVYRVSEPLRFAPADGGNDSRRVTYEAAEQGAARVSGGAAVTGWRPSEEPGVLQASVPYGAAFREMFVNGSRAVRARYPDTGYLRIAAAGPDHRTSFTAEDGDLAGLGRLAGAELVFFHDWSSSRIPIESVDGAASTITVAAPIGADAPYFAIDGFEPNPRYFLENSREFLTAPGEWHLDEAAATVFYRPREGESADSIDAVVPLAEQLVVIKSESGGRPVRGLEFRGIVFEHAAFEIPKQGYAGRQAGFFEPRGDDSGGSWDRGAKRAAFEAENARDLRLVDCTFRHLGRPAVRFGGGCVSCEMSGVTVTDVACSGIMVGETREPAGEVTSGVAIRNCTITRCGQTFFGAVGIWIGMAENVAVTGCEVAELPYTGISLGWRWNPEPTVCKGHQIRDNHIHHVMQVLSDGGGIYTLGRQPGTVLSGNLIHDVPLNAGRAESNGMFLDEGSTDLLIENNIIHSIERSPFRFHRARENRVVENHVVLAPDTPLVRYNATDPSLITLADNHIYPSVEDLKQASPR